MANLRGLIGISDPSNLRRCKLCRDLKAEGLRLMMLTGDSRKRLKRLRRNLGIDDYEAEVLPEKKAEVVQRLQKEGRRVAMAGDGINDAPHWRRQTSASRWEPARTWQWRALA